MLAVQMYGSISKCQTFVSPDACGVTTVVAVFFVVLIFLTLGSVLVDSSVVGRTDVSSCKRARLVVFPVPFGAFTLDPCPKAVSVKVKIVAKVATAVVERLTVRFEFLKFILLQQRSA